MKKTDWLIVILGIIIGLVIAFANGDIPGMDGDLTKRTVVLRRYLQAPQNYQALTVTAGERCNEGPFQWPTTGMVGYVWNDSFKPGHHHSGLDIFGGEGGGLTPVYAAYDGYLNRSADWLSTVIIRIPSDPIQPGRQIWLYYTHMADGDGNSFIDDSFHADSQEVYVKAGTLIGYQGNYSGDPENPVGVHLHFSIIQSDNDGHYLNETRLENTLDPSPYFGLPLTHKTLGDQVPLCD